MGENKREGECGLHARSIYTPSQSIYICIPDLPAMRDKLPSCSGIGENKREGGDPVNLEKESEKGAAAPSQDLRQKNFSCVEIYYRLS